MAQTWPRMRLIGLGQVSPDHALTGTREHAINRVQERESVMYEEGITVCRVYFGGRRGIANWRAKIKAGVYHVRFVADWVPGTDWTAPDLHTLFAMIEAEHDGWVAHIDARFPKRDTADAID